MRILKSAVLAFFYLMAPAFAEEPIELPDSGTSSFGDRTDAEKTPFFVNCLSAETFADAMRKTESVGIVVGDDVFDKSLVLMFKSKAGTLTIARTTNDGSTVCAFAVTSEYEINNGALLRNSEEEAHDF